MYPYISLQIRNHIPKIIYHPEEGTSKKLTTEEQSIYEVLIPIARKLDLIDRELIQDDSEILSELFDLARHSDELYITDLPEIETDDLEFNLENVLNNFLQEAIEDLEEEYAQEEISNEVRKEINRNQNADIFASVLEVMYTILIAKAVIAASELGIGTIKLDDEGKNARLLEKMSKELDKLGVDLIVE